jgi:hypothetical protein
MKKHTLIFSLLLIFAMTLIYQVSGAIPILSFQDRLYARQISVYTKPLLSILFFIPFFLQNPSGNPKKYTKNALLAFIGLILLIMIGSKLPNIYILLPSVLYVISVIGIPFILWSFLAQIYTTKTAIKPYIGLIFITSVIGNIAALVITVTKSPNLLYLYTILALVSLGTAVLILKKVELDNTKDEDTKTPPLFSLLKLSLIFSIPMVTIQFIILLFKHAAKVKYPTAIEYSKNLGSYSLQKGYLSLFFLILLPILIIYMLRRYSVKRNLFFFSASLSVIGTLFLFASINGFNGQYITALGISSIFQSAKIFLLFPLLQLFYLSISKQYRYKAKIWTEVIFYFPMVALLSLIPQILIISTGGFTPLMIHLLVALCFILYISLAFLGKSINHQKKLG